MKYIQNLKQGKSAGPDNIPTVILKDAADCICKPLTMIFNSSFRLGTFPDRWKIARITPIYKSGAKDDTNNYRPISILSVLSKLYEKIAHDQLIDFLQSNKKLTKNQFAFRKLHSTITSLIGVSDHWYSNSDNKKANFALFLDLKKAFDTVDHEILISKLAKYGVKGRENNWLKSYLTNRSQYCSIDGQVSDIMEIECGIPQGSCLGPLLFIIYLNDFEHCLEHSRANMYADDTEITISSNNQAELIETAQAELLNIAEWMRINKLSLNPTKTEYMIIDHPRRRKKGESLPQLSINREMIKQVHKTKYLGVIVDDTLGWEEQYGSVKKKVAGGLVAMKKLKDILPQSMLFQVYKALVESHFRYADVVWGSLSNTKTTALQRLQNRAFEIIRASKIKDSWIRPTFSIDHHHHHQVPCRKALETMFLHSSLSCVFVIKSTVRSSPAHFLTPSRIFSLGRPRNLFPSTRAVVIRFSNPCLLMACPKKFACCFLILLLSVNFLPSSLSILSLVRFSVHGIFISLL